MNKISQKTLFSILFWVNISLAFAQSQPCQIPINVSLDSAQNFIINREIEKAGSLEKFYKHRSKYQIENLFKKRPKGVPVDSFFQVAQKYLYDRMPDSLVYKHLTMDFYSFNITDYSAEFIWYFNYTLTNETYKRKTRFVFAFRKIPETTNWDFKVPDNLLDCKSNPNRCIFQSITEREATELARKAGFADRNEYLSGDFNENKFQYEVTKYVGDGLKMQAIFDSNDGKKMHYTDTINTNIKWSERPSISQSVSTSPLVFEAIGISEPIGYETDTSEWSNVYTAHLLKIQKIFKGEFSRDTVVVIRYGGRSLKREVSLSHGTISLPYFGHRAMIFATSLPDSVRHFPSQEFSRFPIYVATNNALMYSNGYDIPPFWAQDYENNLYKPLEILCKQPRKVVSKPIWITSLPFDKSETIEFPLIAYKIRYMEINEKDPQKVDIKIDIASLLEVSYPTSGSFYLRYNPLAFGKLNSSKKQQNFEWADYLDINGNQNDGPLRAVLSSDYELKVRNLNDSTLVFYYFLKNKKVKPIMLDFFDEMHTNLSPFISLTLLVKDSSQKMGIQILKPTLKKYQNKHFDYETLKEKKYKQVLVENVPNLALLAYQKAIITDFFSDTITAGTDEILTIKGRNFCSSDSVTIFIPCELNGEKNFYGKIPSVYFLEKTDTLLRLKIPMFFGGRTPNQKMKPRSDYFSIVKYNYNQQLNTKSPKTLQLKANDWDKLKVLNCKQDCVSKVSANEIDSMQITLTISHSWGAGDERYDLSYRFKNPFFETIKAKYQHFGRNHPPNRKGEGKKTTDSLFYNKFSGAKFQEWMQSLAHPKPMWNEKDFGYKTSTFLCDLSTLKRNRISGNETCEDCSYYNFEATFFSKDKHILTLNTWFDSGFRLPITGDPDIVKFRVNSMLEWMYLYQFSQLIFPKDVALNKQFFNEKSLDGFSEWVKLYFFKKE
jgi:hypothetical protein